MGIEYTSNGLLVEENLGSAYGVIAGARSGLMTVLSAGDDCYLLRNVAGRPFKITMARIRLVTTTAFGSAQCLAFQFHKVYGCTAVHSGGTPTTFAGHWRFQGNVPKTSTGDTVEQTVVVSPTLPDVQDVALNGVISGTAALTGATYTAPDADEPEFFAIAAGSTLPAIYEDWQPRDGLPLVLEQNTGLLGRVTVTMGATGVGRLYVGIDGYYL